MVVAFEDSVREWFASNFKFPLLKLTALSLLSYTSFTPYPDQ
jgi:hypothetical protein